MCDNVALALIFLFFNIFFPLKLPDLNGNSNLALSRCPRGHAEGRGQEGTAANPGKGPAAWPARGLAHATSAAGPAHSRALVPLAGGWGREGGQKASFFPKPAAMGSAIISSSCQKLGYAQLLIWQGGKKKFSAQFKSHAKSLQL